MPTLPQHPDLILHNARVYTVDQRQPWAEAIAIRQQHLLAVGGDVEILPLATSATTVLDLNGKLVLPGFCDAHIHCYDWSLGQDQVQLADCRSKDAMLARIAARAAITPSGEWILGRGWNESRWGDHDFPTAADLATVTGAEQPAIFWRSDMHSVVTNEVALRLAQISAATPDPDGGVIVRDETGQPTGILKERAIDLLTRQLSSPSAATLARAVRQAMTELHRLGVTAVHDQRVWKGNDGPRMLALWQELRQQGELRLRVNCNLAGHDLPHLAALGLRGGFGDDYLRLGHVKFFADGSLGSRSCWMLEPFATTREGSADEYGVVLTPPDELAAAFRQVTVLGFPLSVHAIGDQANRTVLDLFEELLTHSPALAIPHRIEHAQTLHRADLARFAQLGLTASIQPLHCTDDIDTAALILGPRSERLYRFGALAASGALLALGSDAPVADANPFLGIHAALFRQRPDRMNEPPWYGDERLTLPQAIYGYTLGAAHAVGWAQSIGSLQPGKRADLIVLDRDLFTLVEQGVTSREIADTQVLMTIFDGEIVHTKL
jgi:hypothetical protein